HYPPLYLQRLGWAYLDVGRYAEAIIALKQVLLWNPNYVLAYTLLAASYGLQWISQLSQDPETLAQAFAMAQKAIALNASVSWTHMGLGYVYLGQKQYDQALAEMERAIALDPNFALSYEGLAAVLSSVGRSEEAVESVEKALRLDPSRVDQNSFDLGSAYSS